MRLTMFVAAAIVLLLGCGEQAGEDVTAPAVAAIPSSEEGPLLQALEAMGENCRGKQSCAEWLASPAGQMLIGLKHCEDIGLGIDDGMGPSPPEQPDTDGGAPAGGGGGGAD